MIRALGLSLLAFTFGAAGCEDDESSAPAQPNTEQSAEDLRGRTFISTAVTEDGEPRPLVHGTRIRLIVEEQEDLRWHLGCNDFGANVEITADSLLVGQIAGTEAGCPDDLQVQDEWVADFLDSDPEWRLSNAGLALTSDGNGIEFEASNG